MQPYFRLPRPSRIRFSFLINAISTLVGFPLAYWAGTTLSGTDMLTRIVYLDLFYFLITPLLAFSYFKQLLWGFVGTIFVEFFGLLFFIKPKPPVISTLKFSILANIASYLALLVIPPLIMFCLGLLISMFSA